MSFRAVVGLACATAALLAPAAHADTARVCARPFGSAVPGSVQKWFCVGGSHQNPGCLGAAVNNPNGSPAAGVEVCGLL